MSSTCLIRVSCISLLSVMLSSCAATGSLFDAPRVSLTGVELTSASLKQQTFLLSFEIANPNPFPLPVSGLEYRLLFDDEKFAAGKTAGAIDIPSNGEESFAISVDLDILKSATQLSSLLRSGLRENIAYDLSGRLTLDLPMVRPVPFSNSGVVNLTRTASGIFD